MVSKISKRTAHQSEVIAQNMYLMHFMCEMQCVNNPKRPLLFKKMLTSDKTLFTLTSDITKKIKEASLRTYNQDH